MGQSTPDFSSNPLPTENESLEIEPTPQHKAVQALLFFIESRRKGLADSGEVMTFLFKNSQGTSFRKIFLAHNAVDLARRSLETEVQAIFANAANLLKTANPILEISFSSLRIPAESGNYRNFTNQASNIQIEKLQAEPNPAILRPLLLANLEASLATLDQHDQLTLRLCQLKAIQDFRQYLGREDRPLKGYFVLATGAGKTVLFGIIMKLLNRPTMIYVPNLALVTQIKKELIETVGIPENDIGILDGDTKQFGKKYTVCTYQSHLSLMRGENLHYLDHLKKVSLLICDEAHRAMGDKTSEELDLSQYPQFNDVLKLGFTATPIDAKKHIESQFEYLISHTSYAELVEHGVLVPFHLTLLDGYILNGKEMIGGLINPDYEDGILTRERVYEKLIDNYLLLREKMKVRGKPLHTSVFCNKINQVHRFADLARAQGLRPITITSDEFPTETTIECYERVKAAEKSLIRGEAEMLITVKKLSEGWDFPELNCTIMADITTSPRRMIQTGGRSSRAIPGKTESHYLGTDWQIVNTANRGTIEWFAHIKKRGIKAVGLLPGMSIKARHNLIEAFRKNGESFENIRKFCLDAEGQPLSYEFFTAAKIVQPQPIAGRKIEEAPADYFTPEKIREVFTSIARQFGIKDYKLVTHHRFGINIVDTIDGQYLTGAAFISSAKRFFGIEDDYQMLQYLVRLSVRFNPI